MKIFFYAFVILMLAGNCFGLYQLLGAKQEIISKFPKLNEKNFILLQVLPAINIIALFGLLFFKSWAPWLVIGGASAVILADIYFSINYHLFLAIPSFLILLFFIIKYKNHF
jgi:hypothetical protein